jgi:hypothetical protein
MRRGFHRSRSKGEFAMNNTFAKFVAVTATSLGIAFGTAVWAGGAKTVPQTEGATATRAGTAPTPTAPAPVEQFVPGPYGC